DGWSSGRRRWWIEPCTASRKLCWTSYVPRRRAPCHLQRVPLLLFQLVERGERRLQLFHRIVAVGGEADGAFAQRAHDMGPLQRVVGLHGMRGSEADDRRAVRLGAR